MKPIQTWANVEGLVVLQFKKIASCGRWVGLLE